MGKGYFVENHKVDRKFDHPSFRRKCQLETRLLAMCQKVTFQLGG